ncbi:MAG: hypothetical protein PVI37_10115 [Gammaproteobacteria bacterium]|jgi:hypothetical protein
MMKFALPVLLLGLVMPADPAIAAGCADRAVFHELDFWVGDWNVHAATGGTVATSRVRPQLDGCMLEEDWQANDGGRARAMLHVSQLDGHWRLLWIDDHATRVAGTREEAQTATLADGGVRFQGQLHAANGTVILTRTTLEPLRNGNVRRVDEWSDDGGMHWRTWMNVIYQKPARTRQGPAGSS